LTHHTTETECYVIDVVAQTRGRLSLFIRAVENVGIIPLLAWAAITLASFRRDGTVPLAWRTAAVGSCPASFIFALHLVDIAYNLERFALISSKPSRTGMMPR